MESEQDAKAVFLSRVRADRGPEIAKACEELLAAYDDVNGFDSNDILQIVLERRDEVVAQRGLLHLAAVRRCNS